MHDEIAKYVLALLQKIQKAAPVAATGSSGKRGPNKYAKFMSLLGGHNKGKLIDLMVSPSDHFTTGSKSKATFDDQDLKALLGVPIQFGDLFTQIHDITGNLLKTTGVIWGLLSDEERADVLATA